MQNFLEHSNNCNSILCILLEEITWNWFSCHVFGISCWYNLLWEIETCLVSYIVEIYFSQATKRELSSRMNIMDSTLDECAAINSETQQEVGPSQALASSLGSPMVSVSTLFTQHLLSCLGFWTTKKNGSRWCGCYKYPWCSTDSGESSSRFYFLFFRFCFCSSITSISFILDVKFKFNLSSYFLVPQETKISRIEGKQVVFMWPTLFRFPIK